MGDRIEEPRVGRRRIVSPRVPVPAIRELAVAVIVEVANGPADARIATLQHGAERERDRVLARGVLDVTSDAATLAHHVRRMWIAEGLADPMTVGSRSMPPDLADLMVRYLNGGIR